MLKSMQYFLEVTAEMDTEVSEKTNSLIAWRERVVLVVTYRPLTNDFTAIAVEGNVDEVKAAIEGTRLFKSGRYSIGWILYNRYRELGFRRSDRLHVCNHDHSLYEVTEAVADYMKKSA